MSLDAHRSVSAGKRTFDLLFLFACANGINFTFVSNGIHISDTQFNKLHKNSHINVFIASLWTRCLFDKWFSAEDPPFILMPRFFRGFDFHLRNDFIFGGIAIFPCECVLSPTSWRYCTNSWMKIYGRHFKILIINLIYYLILWHLLQLKLK